MRECVRFPGTLGAHPSTKSSGQSHALTHLSSGWREGEAETEEKCGRKGEPRKQSGRTHTKAERQESIWTDRETCRRKSTNLYHKTLRCSRVLLRSSGAAGSRGSDTSAIAAFCFCSLVAMAAPAIDRDQIFDAAVAEAENKACMRKRRWRKFVCPQPAQPAKPENTNTTHQTPTLF